MGMSTHVVGFKPADETWKKMKNVWYACKVAGVAPPLEVDRFFNGEAPDDAGVEVVLGKDCLKEWNDEGRAGYEVDMAKLPAGVKIIRFYNSY